MPSCVHAHKHNPWPSAGPLTICPGERTCGYCKGKDAKFDHSDARNLRKHVYQEHTDGGKKDYGGVEVMMYRPWAQSTVNPHHISREEAEGDVDVSQGDEESDGVREERRTAAYGRAVGWKGKAKAAHRNSREEAEVNEDDISEDIVLEEHPAAYAQTVDGKNMAKAKALALDGAGMAGAKALALDGAAAGQKPENPKRWKSQAGKNSAAEEGAGMGSAKAFALNGAAVAEEPVNPKRWKSQAGKNSAAKKALLWRQARAEAAARNDAEDVTAAPRGAEVEEQGATKEKREGWKSEAGKRSQAVKERKAREELRGKASGPKRVPEPIDTEAAQQLMMALPNSGLVIKRSFGA